MIVQPSVNTGRLFWKADNMKAPLSNMNIRGMVLSSIIPGKILEGPKKALMYETWGTET